VTIGEPDVGPVQVQRPRSKDVMVDLFGDSILEVPCYFLRPYEVDGMVVLVLRTGYTAELGYEIYLFEATRYGERLWDAVLEAGRPHDIAVIGPCHIRRVEAGILAHGADMWFGTNPYEVGMGYDWMVDLEQKADFIGEQALARIKEEGPARKQAGSRSGGTPSVPTTTAR
jgi:glycine cleavage system aminomethyltransferase T